MTIYESKWQYIILLGLSHQKVSRRFHNIQSCCTMTRTTAYNCLQRGSMFRCTFQRFFNSPMHLFKKMSHSSYMQLQQFRPSRTVETHLCQTPPAAWLAVVCHTMEQSLLPFAQRRVSLQQFWKWQKWHSQFFTTWFSQLGFQNFLCHFVGLSSWQGNTDPDQVLIWTQPHCELVDCLDPMPIPSGYTKQLDGSWSCSDGDLVSKSDWEVRLLKHL